MDQQLPEHSVLRHAEGDDAILNEIDGKSHLGNKPTQVPTIFGMNFQALSVGQKLIEASNSTTGGYLDAAGTPGAALLKRVPVRRCFDWGVCERTEKAGTVRYDADRDHGQAWPVADRSEPVCVAGDQCYVAGDTALECGVHSELGVDQQPDGHWADGRRRFTDLVGRKSRRIRWPV